MRSHGLMSPRVGGVVVLRHVCLGFVVLLPVTGWSGQTFDGGEPAFAGATIVPLDDTFLDATAIDGTTQFTFTAGSVMFTFSSTAPFQFLGVGQPGDPLNLFTLGTVQVTPGGAVEALGFDILANEGPTTGVYVGASGTETIVYPLQTPAFGGAFGIGDISSATLTPRPLATWNRMRFVPSSATSCQADTDCATGELCSVTTNTCVAGTPCASDVDCSGGEVCSATNLVCVPGTSCSVITDCGAGEYCSASTNTCVAGTSCASDLDCSSGEVCSATNQVCVGGSPCSVSSDCVVGEYCSATNDACVPGVACSSAADCGAGEFCSATQQVCLPGTAPCSVTSDCPAGELCSVADEICVAGSPCSFNTDCGAGTVCSATNDVCVPGGSTCLLNSDCQAGELCSTADRVCVPGASCTSDADCGSGTFCSMSNGVCQPGDDVCFVGTDCGSGELCSTADNRCVPGVACTSNGDCAAGTFCSRNGVCSAGTTACSADSDCLSGELCSIVDNVCVPGSACVDDSDCGNGTTCSARNGVCVGSGVPCSENNDCAAYLQLCVDSGVCEDGPFAVGLDQFGLEFLTYDGGPPRVGERFGLRLVIPMLEGELQYADLSFTLSNPFRLELLPESFPFLGEVEAVVAGVPLPPLDIRVLDPDVGSVFLDLDHDLQFDLGEPVALVRAGSVLIDMNLPSGGDYDPDQHFIPADGTVTVTLEPILSIGEPSHPTVRVIVTSVDPDTGGPNDGQGVFPRIALRDFSVDVDIDVDIRPLTSQNIVNLKSHGVIPVAILSTDTFSAPDFFDPSTARFGPQGAGEAHGRGHVGDVDRDGDLDLVLHFRTRETGIECGETEAVLTAETFAGEAFQGADSIRTIGCKGRGKPKPHRYWWLDLLRRWPWWHHRGM